MTAPLGDRRSSDRFELVRPLPGTLDLYRRFEVRNIGVGGALVETTAPLFRASRVSGRLLFGGRSRDVRGEVRHVTSSPQEEGMGYLVGMAWDASPLQDDLSDEQPADASRQNAWEGIERRRHARLNGVPDVILECPMSLTVQLLDLSLGGALLAAPALPETGDAGQLRARLGDRPFAAQLKVRHAEGRLPPQTGCRVGVAFGAMDEVSRVALEDFVGKS